MRKMSYVIIYDKKKNSNYYIIYWLRYKFIYYDSLNNLFKGRNLGYFKKVRNR